MCVRPQAINSCPHEMKPIKQSYCFSVSYMTLAVDKTDGHGLSNKACHECQGNAVFAIH